MTSGADAALGAPLPSPPADGVTALRFAPGADALLAASWDGRVSLYDAAAGAARGALRHATAAGAAPAPVLDADWAGPSHVLSAGLDGRVLRHDAEAGGGGGAGDAPAALGAHDAAASCVHWLGEGGGEHATLAASASWDGSLKVWDWRCGPAGGAVAAAPLGGKAYSVSLAGGRLVAATSARGVLAFELRALRAAAPGAAAGAAARSARAPPAWEPAHTLESPLRHQTRCVATFPDGAGFAVASVEGRVALEWLPPAGGGGPPAQPGFAFKCHRRAEGGRELVFPVNAVAFNARWGTLATGGADGSVCVWDGAAKKRLAQFSGYAPGVSALAFNGDATLLAVAASYTFERGDVPHAPDAVHVRRLAEAEVRPKARAPPPA